MNWFFEKSARASARNGELIIFRRLGRWEVIANGSQQTGNRLNDIWRDAVGRTVPFLEKENPSVLILGFGAGGMLKDLYKRTPNCRITAVEHDPVMISLAKESGLSGTNLHPVIIEGDAGDVVHKLDEKFDLIVVDLFCGAEPSPLLRDGRFLSELRSKTLPGGAILVNVFRSGHLLDFIDDFFPRKERWKYKDNWLGAFYCG